MLLITSVWYVASEDTVLLIELFFCFLQRREVYHTKRMQHVICVKWSADSKYILSGSDEMNIRLWKANAAEKLGAVSPHLLCVISACIFSFSRFLFKAVCCLFVSIKW